MHSLGVCNKLKNIRESRRVLTDEREGDGEKTELRITRQRLGVRLGENDWHLGNKSYKVPIRVDL